LGRSGVVRSQCPREVVAATTELLIISNTIAAASA
jgi:hypothetical protein